MSLTFAPKGFTPIRTLNGGDIRIGRYTVGTTSLRIFKGDAVRLQASTGLIVKWRASSVSGLLGVAARDSGVISAAITDFPVYDDPSTVFECQSSLATAVTQVRLTGFGHRIASTVTARVGDTTLGYSKAGITFGATAVASASYVVMAIRLAPKLGNDLSAYSVVECLLAGDPTKTARD